MGVSLAPEDLGGDIQCIPISALKASTFGVALCNINSQPQ